MEGHWLASNGWFDSIGVEQTVLVRSLRVILTTKMHKKYKIKAFKWNKKKQNKVRKNLLVMSLFETFLAGSSRFTICSFGVLKIYSNIMLFLTIVIFSVRWVTILCGGLILGYLFWFFLTWKVTHTILVFSFQLSPQITSSFALC